MKGRTGYQIGTIIENELKKGVKSGKELKKKVITTLGPDEPLYFQKAYDRSLIELLEKEKIKIVDYDPSKDSRKSKQAFKSDPLVFDSSERLTRPKIQKLLNNMGENDDSYQKLRMIFTGKFNDLHEFYVKRWLILKEKTFKLTPDEFRDILSEFPYYVDIKEAVDSITKDDKKKIMDLSDQHNVGIKSIDGDKADADIGYKNAMMNYIEKLYELNQKIYEKNSKNSFYPDQYVLSEKNKIKIETHIPDISDLVDEISSKLVWIEGVRNENVNIWFFPCTPSNFNNSWFEIQCVQNFYEYQSLTKKSELPFLLDGYSMYFLSGWTKDNALYSAGFRCPYYNLYDSNIYFENMVDIISTYPDGEQKILMGILAKGLSNEVGAIEVFAEFIKKIIVVDYPKRLNEILKIETENTKT